MNDLDKFKHFLDEMNIAYKVNEYWNGDRTIEILSHLNTFTYGANIEIEFNTDKNFKYFTPYGE